MFAWDWTRRSDSSFYRAGVVFQRCYEERRAATGASVSVEFPECREVDQIHERGESARMTSAALMGGAAGIILALLFFGIRLFRGGGEASD